MRIAQRALLQSTGELPAAFERLEYIQSNGYQYINTGYMTNDNSSFEVDFVPLAFTGNSISGYYIYPFGAYDATVTPKLMLVCSGDKEIGVIGGWICFGDATTMQYRTWDATLNTRYSLTYSKTGLTLNGSLIRPMSDIAPFQMAIPVYLFGISKKTTAGGTVISDVKAQQRVYSFIIREGNILKRNFIPVKRKRDNEIGMYDTVTAQFYTNQGTGIFTGA